MSNERFRAERVKGGCVLFTDKRTGDWILMSSTRRVVDYGRVRERAGYSYARDTRENETARAIRAGGMDGGD